MGEDRTTCAEKKNNPEATCRHRHSSVISSCSEDAESESTSAGYPPSPVEEKEEELEYGPGIVNKLRTRFLTITLKQNRGTNIRRSCSMENLLDQEPEDKIVKCASNGTNHVNQIQHVGHLKRAKSMDTLLMELQSGSCPGKEGVADDNKGPKIIKRRDGLHRLCDEELPKPDTVKTYKRMFEPAESRRGSHCRRPPVLRASAKSCAAAKQNGTAPTPSAKVNGPTPRTRYSAKPPTKSHPADVSNNSTLNGTKPPMNSEPSRPLYNGCHVVKANPVKISSNGVRTSKEMEKSLNCINRLLNKKEVHFSPKTDIINNAPQTEVLKIKPSEEIIKQFSKVTTINGIVNGGFKPKIPPNRPSLKPPKSFIKSDDRNPSEKIPPSKSKPGIPNGLKKPVEVENQNGQSNGIGHKDSKDKNTKEFNGKGAVNGVKEPKSIAFQDKIKLKPLEIKPNVDSKIIISEENNTKERIELPAIIKEVPQDTPSLSDTLVKGPSKPEPNLNKPVERTLQLDVKTPPKPLPPTPPKALPPPPEKKTEPSPKMDSTIQPPVIPKREVSELDGNRDVKPQKKSTSGQSTSMVFDFRGKNVVPHVAVLPAPFGCKVQHPKKRPVGPDGQEVANGGVSDEEDELSMDYSVPPPSGVVFEGENVKIGRGSILTKRNKELKISFDDDIDNNTFVYPSENSLVEDPDLTATSSSSSSQSGTTPDGPPSTAPHKKLKSNTTIGTSSSGDLSTYTPSVLRTVDNFEPGMFRPAHHATDDEKQHRNSTAPEEEENTDVRETSLPDGMLKPADPDLISSWSLSAGTSDLLF